MRVLMMTQALDARDPVLGFTRAWVEALADRVATVHVVCLRASDDRLPPNVTVHAVGTRAEAGRLRRFVRFERLVRTLVPHVDVVFGHMVPRYVCVAAPAARAGRRPIVFWYTHCQTSPELRLATAVATFVVTAVPGSFPLTTGKLRPIGHGIDTEWWRRAPAIGVNEPPLVVHVARVSPIKRQVSVLRAMALLSAAHPNLQLAFVGGEPEGHETGYGAELKRLADDLGVRSRVTFTGAIPPADVKSWVHRALAAVNVSPAGLFDKAALESMIAGVPTIVAGRAFDGVLGDAGAALRAVSDDPTAVADALDRVLAMPSVDRDRLAEDVRGRASAAHGLSGFADRLVGLMRDAAQRGRSVAAGPA